MNSIKGEKIRKKRWKMEKQFAIRDPCDAFNLVLNNRK